MKPIEPEVASGERLIHFGEGRKEYSVLPGAVDKMGTVTTEWELSAEDLETVLNGGRIRIRQMTFFQAALQPISVEAVPS